MNDEVQYYIDSFHTQKKLRIEDTHFYKIALNLTGNRDKYEQEAFDLIKKNGLLNALKLSRKKNA